MALGRLRLQLVATRHPEEATQTEQELLTAVVVLHICHDVSSAFPGRSWLAANSLAAIF